MSSEPIVAACSRAVVTARGGDPRVGLKVASDAWRRAKAEGSRPALLVALNAVAICQSSNGAHINALGTAIDACRLARDLGDRRGGLHAMLSFSFAAVDLFRIPSPEFLVIVRRCRDEAAAMGDRSLEARAENTLGAAHMIGGEFGAGEEAYERALALLPATDGSTPSSLLLGNLANVAVRLTEVAPPWERAERAAEAHRRLGIALASAVEAQAVGNELRAHANGGWLLMIEGRYEEALERLRRALAIARRIRHQTHTGIVQMQMGDCHAAMGHDAEAAAAYEAGYAVADDIRPDRILQVVCTRRAHALERMGDRKGAARARAQAAEERALHDRELSHARRDFERFLEEIGAEAA